MAEENNAEKPKKDFGKLLGLVFVAVNLLVCGGGAFLVYKSTLGYKPPKISNEDLNKELIAFRESLQQNPVIYQMDTITTNLDGLPRRLVRVEINVEMLDEEGFEEVMGLEGETKDRVVRILNGKKFQNIETVQGKLHLKNEIISSLNSSLKRGVVKNVYFSQFVVQ